MLATDIGMYCTYLTAFSYLADAYALCELLALARPGLRRVESSPRFSHHRCIFGSLGHELHPEPRRCRFPTLHPANVRLAGYSGCYGACQREYAFSSCTHRDCPPC